MLPSTPTENQLLWRYHWYRVEMIARRRFLARRADRRQMPPGGGNWWEWP